MKTSFGVAAAFLLLTACSTEPFYPKHEITTADGQVIRTNTEFVLSRAAYASDEDELLYCHMQRVTGSHIQKYLCMTRDEWDKQRDNSQWAWHKATKCGTSSAGSRGGIGMTSSPSASGIAAGSGASRRGC